MYEKSAVTAEMILKAIDESISAYQNIAKMETVEKQFKQIAEIYRVTKNKDSFSALYRVYKRTHIIFSLESKM